MKILFITMRFPWPLLKGDQKTVYERLVQINNEHDVTLVTFYEKESELDDVDKLKKYCKGGVYAIKFNKKLQLLKAIGKGIMSRIPYQLLLYENKEMRRKISELSENDFDIVHFFLIRSSIYRNEIKSSKCIIDCVDSMTLNLERRVITEKFPIKYLVMKEYNRVKEYEQTIQNMFNSLIVTAARDATYICSNKSNDNVFQIPVTVNINDYFPNYKNRKFNRIIFSGNMQYYPNNQAMNWFIDNVMNKLKDKDIDFEFVIAGKNPSNELKKQVSAYHNVWCTGYVKSMADELNKASIAVAPMKSGSGMQGKILEAMSCGLPVITTSLGKGSIGAKDKDGLFIADSPEEFVDLIVRFISNKELSRNYGEKARRYIEKNHDVNSLKNKLSKIYEGVCN